MPMPLGPFSHFAFAAGKPRSIMNLTAVLDHVSETGPHATDAG
jgi:hypothetical protein